jgi:hypothetical protein
VRALNTAVQHAFVTFTDFNTGPTPLLPFGPLSEYPTAGPVVATVNLANAMDAHGQLLQGTRIVSPDGTVLLQRSNVVITTALGLPGFDGRVRASRVHHPVADRASATGYRFVADGTSIWTANAPPADRRNVFTVLPGRGVVPFARGNAQALAPYLGVDDVGALIEFVRALPPGAVTTSTPAVLTPPSSGLADADYRVFADSLRDRRAFCFVGADDGMLHAFDARTGLEVWAVIPFNLLPRLGALMGGQPVDDFHFFVGGSPQLADVRWSDRWHTLLVFGEGPGGTFYQAFDVTLEGLPAAVPPDVDRPNDLLEWFSNPQRIPFRWSFPDYAHFDATLPDHGDIGSNASDLEKTVGETWSTPAIGRVGVGPDARFVAIVGSGFLARSRERQVNRGGTKAGTRLYLLDVETGAPLDVRDVGEDGVAEDQDRCAASSCDRLKNALHGDPLAVSRVGGTSLASTYLGDLDGHLWRFDLKSGDGGAPAFAGSPRLVFDAGADHPFFAAVARVEIGAGASFLFVGSGSDLLPATGATHAYRMFGLTESDGAGRLGFEIPLETADVNGVDERVTALPALAGDVVFFTTNGIPRGTRCIEPEARLYALTYDGGTAYGRGGKPRTKAGDRQPVAVVPRRRATAPVVADRHLFLATGNTIQVFGDPEHYNEEAGVAGLRILSWREVR